MLLRRAVTAFPCGVTPIRDDVTPLRGGVMALHHDVIALRGDVIALRHDVMALRGDVMALRDGVMALRDGVMALRHDVMALRHDVMALRAVVRALRGGDFCCCRGFEADVRCGQPHRPFTSHKRSNNMANQVRAQFGRDSNEVQALNLTKTSERKAPQRTTTKGGTDS